MDGARSLSDYCSRHQSRLGIGLAEVATDRAMKCSRCGCWTENEYTCFSCVVYYVLCVVIVVTVSVAGCVVFG